jgi:hypothetical protein
MQNSTDWLEAVDGRCWSKRDAVLLAISLAEVTVDFLIYSIF